MKKRSRVVEMGCVFLFWAHMVLRFRWLNKDGTHCWRCLLLFFVVFYIPKKRRGKIRKSQLLFGGDSFSTRGCL